VEQDEREAPGTGATRSQNVVYTLPHDWETIPQFLAPALERVDAAAGETQLLVITADADTALAISEAALALRGDEGPAVLPATSVARAARQLRAGAAPVVVGSPESLAALVRASALKLDAVRSLILVWADDVIATSNAAALESVLTEVPKDAARVLVTTEATPEVEALIERYMRRARRITPDAAADEPAAPLALTYAAVAPAARPALLRRLLDELDPPSAVVVTGSPESAEQARRALRGLGYGAGDAGAVRVSSGEVDANTDLVVLYDVPADRAAVVGGAGARPGAGGAGAAPRQLPTLRRVTGGPVQPFVATDVLKRAASREAALRAELRDELLAGGATREVLALEPLLTEFDALDVAAASLRLLERERARRAAQTAAPRALTGQARAQAAGARGAEPSAPSVQGAMIRIFMTVGERDGVSPGDLVGAIANEGGIDSGRIGKIELRDAHALVEIAAADAAQVAERLNGVTIKGRRAVVRLEREKPPRDGGDDRPRRPAGGDRRPTSGGARSFDRPADGRSAGGRSFDRPSSDRPRSDRPDRPRGGGDRPSRPANRPEDRGGFGRPTGGPGGAPRTFTRDDGPRGFGGRDDRGAREKSEQRSEWAGRGERMQNARRPRRDDA
jgi:ATP-dependent RNA helicase DeaD